MLLSAYGVFSFIFHLSIGASFLFFLLSVLGFICVILYSRRSINYFPGNKDLVESKGEYIFAIPALLFFVMILMIGYRIEMPSLLGQEDNVTIMMAQKIRTLHNMKIDALLFSKGEVNAYIVPIYSYILALLSYVSGLEIVQIYVKIRFVLSLIAISAAYSITKSLFPKIRELSWLVLLFVCASVWSGWGAKFSADTTFSQFLPYSQYSDFALCVCLPVCFLFFISGYRFGTRFFVLSGALTCALFFIHGREALVLLILYFLSAIGLYFYDKNLKMFLRAAGVIGIVVIFGLFIKLVQQATLSPFLLHWDADIKSTVYEKISLILASSKTRLFYPPLVKDPEFLLNCHIFYLNPYYLFSVFVMPVLVYFRRNFGVRTLLLCLIGPLAISIIPLISLLFIKLTYSQILFGAPVTLGMFPFAYIVFTFFVWSIFMLLSRFFHVRRFKVVSLCLLALLFPIFFHLAQLVYSYNLNIFWGWVFFGTVFGFWFGGRKDTKTSFPEETLLKKKNLFMVPAVILLLIFSSTDNILFLKAVEYSSRYKTKLAAVSLNNLWDEYRNSLSSPSVSNWEVWYLKSSYKSLPWDTVQFIRGKLPHEKIFAAPATYDNIGYSALYNIPTLTGEFVYTSGSFISLFEGDFFEKIYRMRFNISPYELMKDDNFRHKFLMERNMPLLSEPKKVQFYAGLVILSDEFMSKYQPFFNDVDSAETKLHMLDEFKIDYIFITPEWYPGLAKILFTSRSSWRSIYFNNGYCIAGRVNNI